MEPAVDSVLQPGTVLSGRYRIESVLGQGGMGSVYLARISTLGDKPVAIKEMRLETLSADPRSQQAAVEQFRQEAKFLANLDHVNLVQVSDFFEENGRNYLVMAYVKGQTLADLLKARKGAFPVQKVLEWGHQLCSVLHYLHTQNPPILFRDLKPSNIMLDEAGRIRLIDFGIARSFSPDGQTATFLQGMGSAGYSPLEQYQGAGGTDPRSDIYALGATMFHLLTNRQPPSPVELLSEGKTMPSPLRWNPTLPPALEQILLKMLATRKDERYQSMAEVAAALTRIEQGLQAEEEDSTENLGPIQSASVSAPLAAGGPTAMAAARAATATVPASPALEAASLAGVAAMPGASQEKALWLVAGGLCVMAVGLFAVLFWSARGSNPTTASSTPALRLEASATPSAAPRQPVARRREPSPSPTSSRPRPATALTTRPAPAAASTPRPASVVVHKAPSLGDDSPSVPTAVRKPKPLPQQPASVTVPAPASSPPPSPPEVAPPQPSAPADNSGNSGGKLSAKNWPSWRPKVGDPDYWNPPPGHPDHIEGAPLGPPPAGAPPKGARYDPNGNPLPGGPGAAQAPGGFPGTPPGY